ncbi:MAG: hypothetical protein NT027_19095 [Proteobacteria bacterium]|jgi:hypothetical protein|nr:hypothetical protein [Pseudomonadota bacterium]
MGAISQGRRGGVRSMLVEPYLQVKLGLMFILVNLVFSVLILLTMGWYVFDIFGTMTSYFQLAGIDAGAVLGKLQFPLAVVVILVLGFVATTLLFAVSYTHKIYGPLISINRYLDEIIEGKKPGKLVLREGDQLQDLAAKLNTIAEQKL